MAPERHSSLIHPSPVKLGTVLIVLAVSQLGACHSGVWPSRGMVVVLNQTGPSESEARDVLARELSRLEFRSLDKVSGPHDQIVSIEAGATETMSVRLSQKRDRLTQEADRTLKSLAIALESRWPNCVRIEPNSSK
jgi:hypothetical protein